MYIIIKYSIVSLGSMIDSLLFSQHIDPLGVKLLHLHMGSMPGYCNCNYESKIQLYNGSMKNLHVNVSISTINQCYSHINKC